MTLSQDEQYPGWPEAAWLPAHDILAQREPCWTALRPKQVCSLARCDAASALNCSLRNIHKTCQGMGTTFGRLLLDARLSAATQTLACTGSPRARISDIAFGAGFSDISHFCKVFRLRFGVAPTEFRRQRC